MTTARKVGARTVHGKTVSSAVTHGTDADAAATTTCTDPVHHVHGGEDFLREVEAACRERGLRLTKPRSDVLRLLADNDRPIKAYDLLERMQAAHGRTAPPTVYRALDFLLSHGFIHRLESINAYLGCHHPRAELHAVPFLICDRCHAAIELEDTQVTTMLETQARALGFRPQAQTLEVHGLCSACSEQ